MNKKSWAAAFLIAAGTAGSLYGLTVKKEPEQEEAPPSAEQETLTPLEKAKEKISSGTDGTVTSIQDITGDGEPRAEAFVEETGASYRVVVDLETGETLSQNQLTVSEMAEAPGDGSVSQQAAEEAALMEVEGSVTEVEMVETSEGNHYKVTVENEEGGADVYVQAATAGISSVSRFSAGAKEGPAAPRSDSVQAPTAPSLSTDGLAEQTEGESKGQEKTQ